MKVLRMVVWYSRIAVEKEELKERGSNLRRGIKRFAFLCEQEK